MGARTPLSELESRLEAIHMQITYLQSLLEQSKFTTEQNQRCIAVSDAMAFRIRMAWKAETELLYRS